MKKARIYKTVWNFRKAVEKLPAVPLTYVNREKYVVLDLSTYKVFQHFNIKPAAIHPDYTPGRHGWKYSRISGYRVSLEVGRLVETNAEMIKNLAKYI